MILPLWTKIDELATYAALNQWQRYQDRFSLLRKQSQEFFGIEEEDRSESGWKAAVVELEALSLCQMPRDKLKCLLSTARAIYNLYNYEQNLKQAQIVYRTELAKLLGSGKPIDMRLVEDAFVMETYFLSADEFMPIWIFVVAQASAKVNLFKERMFMVRLADRASLRGESEFYLTFLDSAIDYLSNCPLPIPIK